MIGLQLYSLRTETEDDLLGVIKKVAEVGYDGVEFAGFFNVPVPDIKAVLDDCGLKCAGGHFGTDALASNLDQIIADAQALGFPAIACPGFWGVDYEDEATFHHFASLFNRVGEACRAAGLDFLYHVHGHEFVSFGGRTGMDILVEETDPNFMLLQPDVYWVQKAGIDPASFVETHADRIRQLHMKDSKSTTDWQDTEVGAGVVNIQGALEASKKLSLDWYVVEQEAFDIPMYESIAISLKNLREMLSDG